jgi:cell division protein ZapA
LIRKAFMSSSKKIQIYGKTYSLKSSSSELDAEEVAGYLDSRMRELATARSKTSTLDLAILAALNIAQELLELKGQIEVKGELEEEKIQQLVAALDKELQDVEK